jgi:hypothetical protein
MARKLAKSFNLLDHTINTEYLKYTKIPEKHRVKGREELRKVVTAICKRMGAEIVDRDAGVHIRGLGYFFIWKIPRKMTYNTQVKGVGLEENYNNHTNHHMFSPILLPSLDNRNTLQYWGMDNSFCRNIKQGIKGRIKKGFQYKMYPFSLSNLNRK